ncbi:MAG: hypothetical protein WDZ77_02915 [Candidatus Pacearchaeota archaeon]
MRIKDEEFNSFILDIIGFTLFALGVAAVANSLFIKNPTQIFWGCYLGLLIMGIGIIKRNSFLIMSQVYILAIPMIIWDMDFLHYLILNQPLWGITDYFFLERNLDLSKAISLQHLFSIPLALYATKKIGLKRKDAWKLSLIQITLVYIIVSLFTIPEANINCVFDPCINLYFGIPYRLTWFITIFGMTFLTAILINKFLIKKLQS